MSNPLPPNDYEHQNRSIGAGGDIRDSVVNTGDNAHIYVNRNSPAEIWATFEEHNSRAVRRARPYIDGLSRSIERPEVQRVEDILQSGHPAIVIGPPGTGKSGLAFQLLQNAQDRGQAGLLLDCRAFPEIHNAADLQTALSLGTLSLPRACLEVRNWKGTNLPFLFLLDQLDSVVGTPAENEYRELAIDCQGRADIQVVVFSRRSEMQEQKLLGRLRRETFQEVPCSDLPTALPYLQELGIVNLLPEAEQLARNLLNLSLMAAIKKQNSTFDFSNVSNEVALWEARLEIFIEHNVPEGRRWIGELTELAEQAILDPGGTFLVDNPPSLPHRHLLSEGFIQSRAQISQQCVFVHENLQDFLYAKKAIQIGRSVAEVLSQLGRFRAQNPLVWMDKISVFHDLHDPEREVILRRLLDV